MSAWLGLVVLIAPVTVACSNSEDVPVRQSSVVAVADVRAGTTGTEKAVGTTAAEAEPVTKTVTKTETATQTNTVKQTIVQTRTVTAAPETVRVAAPPTTVTVQAPAATVTETAVQTETVEEVETAAAGAEGLADTSSVYYENCDAARAAGAAPVRAGDPGYRPALDRDGDGIGCV